MKKQLTAGDIVFNVFIAVFLTLFVIVTLYPILNTLAVSFNDGFNSLRYNVYLWPHEWTLDNYKAVFAKGSLKVGLIISASRTLIGTLLSIAVNALLAFVISRKKFLFKKSFSLFWVVTMYVNGGLIPTYLLMKFLHLTGTFWVYVVPGAVSAFNMLVMRNYMNGIPDSLEESAQLDGAGYMKIFISIISPLCKPVYATIALFVAVYQWNAWFDTMIYCKGKEDTLTTLQFELMKLLQQANNAGSNVENLKNSGATMTPTSIRAAATIATMVPIIAIYPFLQNYFVTGLTIGGVKE